MPSEAFRKNHSTYRNELPLGFQIIRRSRDDNMNEDKDKWQNTIYVTQKGAEFLYGFAYNV